jgi:hypothetical protein
VALAKACERAGRAAIGGWWEGHRGIIDEESTTSVATPCRSSRCLDMLTGGQHHARTLIGEAARVQPAGVGGSVNPCGETHQAGGRREQRQSELPVLEAGCAALPGHLRSMRRQRGRCKGPLSRGRGARGKYGYTTWQRTPIMPSSPSVWVAGGESSTDCP